MKLITLNVWGGQVKEPINSFIKKYADGVDIFCFQEVYHKAINHSHRSTYEVQHDFFDELHKLLPNHIGCFCPTVEDWYGVATFVKKDLVVKAFGDISIFNNPTYTGSGGDHSRKMLWYEVSGGELGDKTISILNVHGLWNGKGKTDTPDRLEQSRRIREFMDSVNLPKILCGDFNLLPETESVKILEEGMENHINKHKIKTTRTSLYTRGETSGYHADYIFTSPEIEVLDFKVLPDEVSDHAALLIEFKV